MVGAVKIYIKKHPTNNEQNHKLSEYYSWLLLFAGM